MDTLGGLLTVLLITKSCITVVAQTCQSSPLTLAATAELQSVSSPGYPTTYPSSSNCKWYLDAEDPNYRVFIDAIHYAVEYSPGCSYDGLFLYNGQQSTLFGALCGTKTHRQIPLYKSTGQYATVWFRSDSSVQLQGFTLRYFRYPATINSTCTTSEALTATTTVQYLWSPDFPVLADAGNTCSWLITAGSSTDDIIVEVLYSNMVSGEVCYTDILSIYDGTNSNATKLAEVCSDKVNFVSVSVISSTYKIFLELVTLAALTARSGFVVSYNSTFRGRTVPATTTQTAIPTYSVCATTQVTASSTIQQILSPNYPNVYGNFLDCILTITAAAGDQIFLTLVDGAITSGTGCINDGVAIYDGSSTSAVRLGLFCGEDLMATINSTGSSLTIYFYADGSSSNRGFQMRFVSAAHELPNCVDTGLSIVYLNATSDVQYLSSPNYPSYYNMYASDLTRDLGQTFHLNPIRYHRFSCVFEDIVDETLYWLISNPSDSGFIKVSVEDSRIEASHKCVFDRVSVFKGPCTTFPALGTFCGEETPTYYQNTGYYVMVQFTSDYNVVFKGFNMSYVIVTSIPAEPTDYLYLVGIIVGSIIGLLVLIGLILLLIKLMKMWRATAPIDRRRDSDASTDSAIIRTRNALSALSSLKIPLLTSTAKPKKPKIKILKKRR